jgi:hypothetical protein
LIIFQYPGPENVPVPGIEGFQDIFFLIIFAVLLQDLGLEVSPGVFTLFFASDIQDLRYLVIESPCDLCGQFFVGRKNRNG